MTTYRCVCPNCTAYIGSEDIGMGTKEDPHDRARADAWHEECGDWLAQHKCDGTGPRDGYEDYGLPTEGGRTCARPQPTTKGEPT